MLRHFVRRAACLPTERRSQTGIQLLVQRRHILRIKDRCMFPWRFVNFHSTFCDLAPSAIIGQLTVVGNCRAKENDPTRIDSWFIFTLDAYEHLRDPRSERIRVRNSWFSAEC